MSSRGSDGKAKKTVFESDCTHDQQSLEPSDSKQLVTSSRSFPHQEASSFQPQKPIISRAKSTDELKKNTHIDYAKQTSTDQRKGRGFFDRIRASTNRHTTSEIKPYSTTLYPNRTNNCNISHQLNLPSPKNNKPISIDERSGIEFEEYRLPNPIHRSPLLNESEFKSYCQLKLGYSTDPFPDQSNRNESKYSIDTSNQDDQRQQHLPRDSSNHFPKISNRPLGQDCSVNSSQVSLVSRDFHRYQEFETVSQHSLASQESHSGLFNKNLLDHTEQNLHVETPQIFPQPEPQLMAPSGSSILSRRTTDGSSIVAMQQIVRDNLSSNSNRSSQTYSHRAPGQRDPYINSQNEQVQTPQPSPAPERDINENYKELVTKYKKVKGLYFEKTAQVEQLQNTLANQRLSQSRTSLDDSEYMTRFQRLEGAITNLAFNIRKDWRTIPKWISKYVNNDAMTIGKQEMTAVGRAVVTKFLMDEIFNKTFHPGLPTELGRSLKIIEQNIRRFCPAHNNLEESEALTAKITQWRLTTLEGLKDMLTPPESTENKKEFVHSATEQFTGMITSLLQEPIPPGVKDSVNMIIELAVNISSNLPLESREISIVYPMPGSLMKTVIMKLENPIPSLVNPIAESDGNECQHNENREENSKDMKGHGSLQENIGRKSSIHRDSGFDKNKGEDTSQLIRFAGFLGVEVRGKQVLYKAPVWTLS